MAPGADFIMVMRVFVYTVGEVVRGLPDAHFAPYYLLLFFMVYGAYRSLMVVLGHLRFAVLIAALGIGLFVLVSWRA